MLIQNKKEKIKMFPEMERFFDEIVGLLEEEKDVLF